MLQGWSQDSVEAEEGSLSRAKLKISEEKGTLKIGRNLTLADWKCQGKIMKIMNDAETCGTENVDKFQKWFPLIALSRPLELDNFRKLRDLIASERVSHWLYSMPFGATHACFYKNGMEAFIAENLEK